MYYNANMNIYTFCANLYIECITDISSRSTNHCLRRRSILLTSICNSNNNNSNKNMLYMFVQYNFRKKDEYLFNDRYLIYIDIGNF